MQGRIFNIRIERLTALTMKHYSKILIRKAKSGNKYKPPTCTRLENPLLINCDAYASLLFRASLSQRENYGVHTSVCKTKIVVDPPKSPDKLGDSA